MTNTKKAKHPTLPCSITFTNDDHRYVDELGLDYISVTTLVSRFFPTFDERGTAGRIAQRDNRDIMDVLQEWKLNRDTACAYGTKVHLFAENLIKGESLPAPENEKERIAFKSVENALRGLSKHYEILGTEKVVFDPLYRVSGTIDLPCRHRATGRLAIVDWKPNKSIDLIPRFSQRGRKPIEHIGDCNGNHYMLQFSTYSEIMRGSGYVDQDEPFDNAAVWIQPMNPNPVWIPMRDARKEASDMIALWHRQFDSVENCKYKVTVADYLKLS